MNPQKKLTQEKLKEIFSYEPETGIFTRKVARGRHGCHMAGAIMGHKGRNGYLSVSLDGVLHYNHRLAWLYEYGYFPEYEIDHINQDKMDNRICNLREVTRTCNQRNCGNSAKNVSGVKGVYWRAMRRVWIAQITVNQKKYYLGYHKDFNEAVCTRLAVEQCLGWSGCDNNSPAFQYVQKMLQGEL